MDTETRIAKLNIMAMHPTKHTIVPASGQEPGMKLLVELGLLDEDWKPTNKSKMETFVNGIDEDDFGWLIEYQPQKFAIVLDVVNDGSGDPNWAHVLLIPPDSAAAIQRRIWSSM